MEIPEVSIGTTILKKKKVSKKLLQHAEKYLSEKGIPIDQLTDGQKPCIFKYIKEKRALKWSVVVGCVCAVIMFFIAVCYMRLFRMIADEFMPDTTVITLDDGTKKVVELDRELIGNYGLACAVFGGLIVGALWAAALGFLNVFASFFKLHRTKKIVDAFLPAVRKQKTTEVENPI